MKKPNLFIVGAAKSGTTSLFGYLQQHPQIFLPKIKECRYFSKIDKKIYNPFTNLPHNVKVVDSSNEYYRLFNHATDEKILGDVSPDYLFYHINTINNMKKELNKDIKIIIILRNPIERTFSNYVHLLRDNLTNLSINKYIQQEKFFNENIWYGFRILESSLYYEAVNSFLNNFQNVKIIFFEEFIRSKQNTLKDICKYLDIDENFIFQEPDFTNKTGLPKNKLIDYLLKNNFILKKQIKKLLIFLLGEKLISKKLIKIKEQNLYKPQIDNETKEYLKNYFQKDVENLSKLLNRDLSKIWKDFQ